MNSVLSIFMPFLFYHILEGEVICVEPAHHPLTQLEVVEVLQEGLFIDDMFPE